MTLSSTDYLTVSSVRVYFDVSASVLLQVAYSEAGTWLSGEGSTLQTLAAPAWNTLSDKMNTAYAILNGSVSADENAILSARDALKQALEQAKADLFEASRIDIANAVITMQLNFSAVASVVLNGTRLNPETDYTVSYQQGETVLDAAPTVPGSYTAVITGMGDYAGTIRQPFTINPVISIVNPAENGGTVHVFADYDPETGGTKLSDGDAVTAGTVLTLIADPDAGYQLKNISVRDGENHSGISLW